MAAKLSHKERIERLLSGKEVDRLPVSAWKHFYENELSAEELAKEMLSFQKQYDWDLMKINPRACYYTEDWGTTFKYCGSADEKPILATTAVKSSDDWLKIKPLNPKNGSFGEQLKAVDLIKKGLDGSLDFVQTVFSPLSVAADLTSSHEAFIELMNNGANLESALENITVTLGNYVDLLFKIGVTGIFFATTEWATRDHITEEQYSQYGRPYDLRILKRARAAKFNILHVCKRNNMLPLFKDYPIDIISWNKYEPGNLDFTQADKIFSQTFLGGVDHLETMVNGTPQDVKSQVNKAINDADNHPLIIAPGCTLKIGTKAENIQAMREAV